MLKNHLLIYLLLVIMKKLLNMLKNYYKDILYHHKEVYLYIHIDVIFA